MRLDLSNETLETEVHEDREPSQPEPSPKTPVGVYAAIGVCVLVVLVTAFLLIPRSEEKPAEQTTVAPTTVERITSVATTTIEETTVTKSIDEAKDTLERPTDPATEDDAKTVGDAIKAVIEFAQNDFKGDAYESHARYIDITYVNMLKHIVQGKYTLNPSSIVVTNSDNANVLQFVFDMTDEHGNTVAFAGNYRKFDTQIQLENIKGFNPTGSAASEKQFDPDKAGFHE